MPVEMTEFLLRSSTLDGFCAELCEEVVGTRGAQSILEELERLNVFIVALDDERKWYRYHRLFAELLQHRLHLTCTSGDVATLHVRAGRWLEAALETEAAIGHYLAAKDYGEVFRLVEEQHQRILTSGGLGVLLAWMSQVPEEVIAAEPMAATLTGVFYAFAGHGEEAERWFSAAEAQLDLYQNEEVPRKTSKMRGIVAAVRAFLADMAGRTARVVEMAELADALLPANEAMTRSLVPYTLSRAYRLQGDLDRADHYVEQHIGYSRAADNIWILSGAIHEKVLICRLRGRLAESERVLDEFEDLARHVTSVGPLAKSIAARADLLAERGNLEGAAATADDAVSAVMRWGLPSDVCFCLQTRVRVFMCRGELSAAAEDLSRVGEIVGAARVYASILPRHETQSVRLMLARDDIEQAVAWLDRYRYPDTGNIIDRESVDITRARVMLAAGRISEAQQLLEQLASGAESGARFGRLIEVLVLQAVAAIEPASDAPLRKALEIGEPEGYRTVFIAEGEQLARRIRSMLNQPKTLPRRLVDYASHLVDER